LPEYAQSLAKKETIEGKHSNGGFTSLIASFGALLRSCNPREVRASLRRTSVASTKQRLAAKLGKTVSAKTLSAYQETVSPVPVN
jgi:hypothetical protein